MEDSSIFKTNLHLARGSNPKPPDNIQVNGTENVEVWRATIAPARLYKNLKFLFYNIFSSFDIVQS